MGEIEAAGATLAGRVRVCTFATSTGYSISWGNHASNPIRGYSEIRKWIIGGAVHYYSPKAQAALYKINPKTWKEKPNWNFSILTEVKIPGLITSDDFKFYKHQ